VPAFLLSCLAYLGVALPGSTLGLLWPSMRMSIHAPVGALGIVLAAGVIASAASSAATGRILRTMPPRPPLGGAATAVGLQVAASAVGGAALPSGVGLVIGAFGGWAVGPSLLTLGVAMCAVYWAALR